MHLVNKQLRKVRGETYNIAIDPASTADDILPVAVDKHCSCNWHLSRQTNFVLLYPDGQPVKCLPRSEEPFSLAS